MLRRRSIATAGSGAEMRDRWRDGAAAAFVRRYGIARRDRFAPLDRATL